jgi:hypothetical protein
MQSAYQAILQNKTASQHPSDIQPIKKNSNAKDFINGNYQITTTHYYIKFSPQDSLQYERIANDSILAVSDTPFEYDIDTEGAKYQDPDYEGTDFTYYYSVVPLNYQLPNNVPYENIANLHFTKEDLIPEGAPETELQKVDFFHDLNTEALKLTDNLEDEKGQLLYLFVNSQGIEELLTWNEAQSRGLNLNELVINFNEDDYADEAKFWRRRKWWPDGTLTVYEDAINQNVGVMGAQINVRKWGWLVIRRANTNRDGYFKTSGTRTKRVKYACYFKHNPFFTVKAGTTFWNARDRGTRTRKRENWNRHYDYGVRQFYAFIQNASYDYYTRVIQDYNIYFPGLGMKIVGKNWYNTSSHSINDLGSLTYDIRITIGADGIYRGSDGIYATTIHELTHQGHNNMDSGMFSVFYSGSNNRKILKESWAEGVETIVTNDRYSGLDSNYLNASNDNIGWNYRRQRNRVLEMNAYTPIVSDLIDDYNQSIEYSFLSPNPPIDLVNGYSLNQIQDALDNCRDITCWENNLRDDYFNTTESSLSQLFKYVKEVRDNASNW